MKYYIGKIANLYGEVHINSTVRFATNRDPSEFLDELASKFWGDVAVKNDGYWDFDNGVSTQSMFPKEISKEVFDALDGVVYLQSL